MSDTFSKPSNGFIVLMALLMSVTAMSIDAMLPALSLIASDLGADHANQQQYIISCLFLGLAVGQLIAGPLSDALGRKPLLFACVLLYIAGSFACYVADSMTQLLLGRIVQGLGAAGPIVSCVSIIRDRHAGRQMAQILSLVMMIFIMAPVLAPAFGQGLLYVASWRAIFLFYVVYAAAIMLWVHFSLPETLPPERRTPFRVSTLIHSTKLVLANRATLCYSLAMGCVFAGFIGYLSSTQQIFQQQFEIGDAFVIYFGLQALGFGVSSLLNSRWVETLGMRYLVLRALICMVALGALVAVISLFFVLPFWCFFIFGLLSLFFVGLLFGNLNALAMEPMGDIAGTATAIISTIANIVSLSIGTIIGQAYNLTLIPIAVGFFSTGIVAWLLVMMAERSRVASE